MDRKEYTDCISKGMKGKTFTKEERKLEFCALAKLCSGKIETREEALRICSLPKEPRPEGRRSTRSRKVVAPDMAACIIKILDGSEITQVNLTTAISKCTGQKVRK